VTLDVVLSSGGGFLLLIVALLLYFVPSVVAFVRSHHNKWAIFALNLLLGWTFLGWIAALVWSLTRPSPQPPVVHMVHEQAQPPATSVPPDPPVQS